MAKSVQMEIDVNTASLATPTVPSQSRAADPRGYTAAGAGAPVVMLHSSLGSKSQWSPLAERLAGRYRVIALDLCGYGDNALPASGTPFTLDDEVRVVNDRLDALIEPDQRYH